MDKFILVHDAENSASPIVINSKLIASVTESNVLTGTSYIELNDLDIECTKHGFNVTETREQIFEMLK